MAILRTVNSRSYPAGQRTLTAAAVPDGYSVFKFTFTDESWPAGFSLSAEFEVSPDNGATWRPVGGLSANEIWVNPFTLLPEPRFITCDIGFVTTTQTQLRGTFNISQSFTTGITIEGFE